jgi:hypothetical protein
MSELKDKIYRVENGENNNYLSCFILSLFYNKTVVYSLFLENDNIKSNYIYIQELIKNIINNMKNFNFINSTSLNHLKSILHINKFKDMNEILESSKIEDLYNYLYEIFSVNKVQLINLSNNAIIDNVTYLILECNDYNTTIKNLIKKNYSFKVLNNIPKFMTFKLERQNKGMIIDIQKKITMNSIFNIESITNTSSSESKNLIWYIYTIICYDDEINKYFSYINYNNTWLKITDYNENSITKIEIKSEEYIIKLKSIFLIYILDK